MVSAGFVLFASAAILYQTSESFIALVKRTMFWQPLRCMFLSDNLFISLSFQF